MTVSDIKPGRELTENYFDYPDVKMRDWHCNITLGEDTEFIHTLLVLRVVGCVVVLWIVII